MSDKPWKKWERECAELIGGSRFWANSGEEVDVEGPTILGQCKQVKALSLQALTKLVVIAEAQGSAKGKAGMVLVKHRGGKGKATLPLVVMSFQTYQKIVEVRP